MICLCIIYQGHKHLNIYQFNKEMMSFCVHMCLADTENVWTQTFTFSKLLHYCRCYVNNKNLPPGQLKEMRNLIRLALHVTSSCPQQQICRVFCDHVALSTASLLHYVWLSSTEGMSSWYKAASVILYCVWFGAQKWVGSALCICCLFHSALQHFTIKKKKEVQH